MSVVLAIIPARGGSKGIPGKNMQLLGGTPLIGHTIRAALEATCLSHVVVSTDSPEIAKFASAQGIVTRQLRPPELSTDTAPSVDVVRYEIDAHLSREGVRPTDVVLLQPTSPLRTASHIDAAMARYLESRTGSLVSVCDVGPGHPDYMYRPNADTLEPLLPDAGAARRQNKMPVFLRNGAIYITSVDYLYATGRLFSERPAFYVMDRRHSINIDDPADLQMAQALFTA